CRRATAPDNSRTSRHGTRRGQKASAGAAATEPVRRPGAGARASNRAATARVKETFTTTSFPRRTVRLSDDWAGLLASGSNYLCTLPRPGSSGAEASRELPAVAFAEFVPGYSGGTATDSHRLPYSSPRRQAGGDTQVFARIRPGRMRTAAILPPLAGNA